METNYPFAWELVGSILHIKEIFTHVYWFITQISNTELMIVVKLHF